MIIQTSLCKNELPEISKVMPHIGHDEPHDNSNKKKNLFLLLGPIAAVVLYSGVIVLERLYHIRAMFAKL